MANRTEGFNERLTIAAIVLAAIAILLWVLPLYLGDASELVDSYSWLAAPFTGLTDFGSDSSFYRGRMPAFIVAAFSSIFLLQLRRR